MKYAVRLGREVMQHFVDVRYVTLCGMCSCRPVCPPVRISPCVACAYVTMCVPLCVWHPVCPSVRMSVTLRGV